jgi:hypothetical protein
MNSTIQHVQDVLANTEKGEEKEKAARKFRMTKRDEKKPVGVRSSEKSMKKKRGGEELTDMDLDEQAYAKKAEQGSSEKKEVTTVIVDTNPSRCNGSRRGPQPFRFEASWVEEEQCATIVENAWKTSMEALGDNLGGAIQNVARELGDWGRNVLGDLEKSITNRRKKLEECRRRVVSSDSVQRGKFSDSNLRSWRRKRICIGAKERRHIGWIRVIAVRVFSTNMPLSKSGVAELTSW